MVQLHRVREDGGCYGSETRRKAVPEPAGFVYEWPLLGRAGSSTAFLLASLPLQGCNALGKTDAMSVSPGERA